MRYISASLLSIYRFLHRVYAKSFSLLISGAFCRFGRKSVIVPPLRIGGEKRIAIGNNVFIGSGSWLQALPDGENRSLAITIGSGTSIAGNCVISAVRSVTIEGSVLMARNVYISDHIHKYEIDDAPIRSQGVDKIRSVVVRYGAWIGQNVVICPGVTIGRGAVVGANSVVNADVPDRCVAVGAPAKVVRRMESLAR